MKENRDNLISLRRSLLETLGISGIKPFTLSTMRLCLCSLSISILASFKKEKRLSDSNKKLLLFQTRKEIIKKDR